MQSSRLNGWFVEVAYGRNWPIAGMLLIEIIAALPTDSLSLGSRCIQTFVGIQPRQIHPPVALTAGHRYSRGDTQAVNGDGQRQHRGGTRRVAGARRAHSHPAAQRQEQALRPACPGGRVHRKGKLAVGYQLRWLMRAVVRLDLADFLFALLLPRLMTSSASRYVVHESQTAHAKMVQA